ncbi:MAG: hypothetical protein Q8K02_02935 [Flavobacterium sp.]|nr:hypothetical protein [Flavobacterium sp.]
MSKTLVFEGCPTCEMARKRGSEFGAIAFGADAQEYAIEVLKGGVSGAGVVLVTDMILPRIPIIGTMIPVAVRPIVGGLAALGLAFYLRKTNPSLANGIAIGGVAIASARILQTVLGKTLGLSGYGDVEVLSTEGYRGYGQMEIAENAGMTATGALIAEEMSDGMGTMIATEISGLGYDDEDEDY